MSACPVCGASSAPRIGSRCNVCPAWAVFAKRFTEDDCDINHRRDAWEGFVLGMEHGRFEAIELPRKQLEAARKVVEWARDAITHQTMHDSDTLLALIAAYDEVKR